MLASPPQDARRFRRIMLAQRQERGLRAFVAVLRQVLLTRRAVALPLGIQKATRRQVKGRRVGGIPAQTEVCYTLMRSYPSRAFIIAR